MILKNLKKILKKLPVKLIRFYQMFISPALGSNCRYYPTCSEYAVMEFENDTFFRAFFKTLIRILRCNQLFKGGIDFPVVTKKLKFDTFFIKKPVIKYWLVPLHKKNKDKYILIKVNYGK